MLADPVVDAAAPVVADFFGAGSAAFLRLLGGATGDERDLERLRLELLLERECDGELGEYEEELQKGKKSSAKARSL